MAGMVYRKQLKSVQIAGGEIRRSLVTIGSEPIVLFHKNHPILRPKFTSQEWFEFSHRVNTSKFAYQLDQWNSISPYQYNCHMLAIAGGLGLSPDSWLEGSISVFTLMENPAKILLDVHYDRIESYHDLDIVGFDFNLTMANELLVFEDSFSGDLVHSGFLVFDGNSPLLLSKLGEYPTTVSTIYDVLSEYRGQFDCIHRYRVSDESVANQASCRPVTEVQYVR